MGNKNTAPNDKHKFFENKNNVYNQSNNFINENKEKEKNSSPQFLDIFISNHNNSLRNQPEINKFANAFSSSICSVCILY